jgi:hypothetical protein
MDRSHVEEKLPRLSPALARRVQGRRLKVYVECMDKNFYLINLFGNLRFRFRKFRLDL